MSMPDRRGTGTIVNDRRTGSGEDLSSAEVVKILRQRAARSSGKKQAVDADWEEGKR
ncbi:hypothetical protein [Geomesophilobacter sediminis]|uniref:Uncharacterized protein n=1 Tax=Geomesophilobacter sediminis TaxID=2798584 RepID=A0A8J7IR82_9BACT|nr:hypothetical protein [Geomesophilobacter sediminis]MBJ6725344.1 hypothetical protein [Geomesophilobacter sediminis]